ncbi:odorant receptor Or2-like [Diachasmimorpha longicaudata]|uniref:odorant receptor Or2-like n=1 Tax=Diachasmimorpha longicaudata TaxID=58733 RepID=UPI0030B8A736
MTGKMQELWPMKITYFCLSWAGFATVKTQSDRKLLNILLSVFVIMSITVLYLVVLDLYYDIKEGRDSQEIIAALFPVVLTFLTSFKLISLAVRRRLYERLLQTTREKLWTQSWTEYGKNVLLQCGRQAYLFFIIFGVVAYICGAAFVVGPIVLMRTDNITSPSDRRLPHEIRIGLPGHETPFYEIFYAINVFGITVVTILYFCFDYYLVLMNIFLVGQFDILNNRFEVIYEHKKDQGGGIGTSPILREFKKCVKQHQYLIWLAGEMESLYKISNLAHVLTYSFVICIAGYQLLLAKRLFFIIKYGIFFFGCLLQLSSITLTCHNIKIASEEIANGIYRSNWYYENCSEEGRALCKNFILVFMKTQYPCCLTAWGFFPITLDTLKSVVTTAFSYLTLMRKNMA